MTSTQQDQRGCPLSAAELTKSRAYGSGSPCVHPMFKEGQDWWELGDRRLRRQPRAAPEPANWAGRNERCIARGTALPNARFFAASADLRSTCWLQRAGGAKHARHGKFVPQDRPLMARPRDGRLQTSSIAAIPRTSGAVGRWTPNQPFHGRRSRFSWLGVEHHPPTGNRRRTRGKTFS